MAINVTIITHHPLWHEDTGTRNRIAAIYKALRKDERFHARIGYMRLLNAEDRVKISELKYTDIHSIPSLEKKGADYKKFDKKYYQGIPEQERFFNLRVWNGAQEYVKSFKSEIVIFTYLEQLYLRELIPKSSHLAIDTNDLNSIRASIFNFERKPVPLGISLQSEILMLNGFQSVIAIQEEELAILAAHMPMRKLVYLPHYIEPTSRMAEASNSASLAQVKKEKAPLKVIFPASHQRPNVDGLIWLLSNVWIHLSASDFQLDVYGSIADQSEIKLIAERKLFGNVIFHGIVDDLESKFLECDVVINPCPYGTGLKIKNVEALTYGKPLITTTVGAEGLRPGADRAFLVADTAAENIFALESLSAVENRDQLSSAAKAFISDYFKDDFYFRALLDRFHTIVTNSHEGA